MSGLIFFCILLYFPGNTNIHRLTTQGRYDLRIDLEDFDGNTRYALYKNIFMKVDAGKFRFSVAEYSGDAGTGVMQSGTVQALVVLDSQSVVSARTIRQVYY